MISSEHAGTFCLGMLAMAAIIAVLWSVHGIGEMHGEAKAAAELRSLRAAVEAYSLGGK